MAFNKKGRSANFNAREISVLVEEISTRRHILFGDIAPPISPRIRQEAWALIANMVNTVSYVQRRSIDIRNKWTDLKRRTKGKASYNFKEITKTGGGPINLKHLTPTEEQVLLIISEDKLVPEDSESISCLPVFDDAQDLQELHPETFTNSCSNTSHKNYVKVESTNDLSNNMENHYEISSCSNTSQENDSKIKATTNLANNPNNYEVHNFSNTCEDNNMNARSTSNLTNNLDSYEIHTFNNTSQNNIEANYLANSPDNYEIKSCSNTSPDNNMKEKSRNDIGNNQDKNYEILTNIYLEIMKTRIIEEESLRFQKHKWEEKKEMLKLKWDKMKAFKESQWKEKKEFKQHKWEEKKKLKELIWKNERRRNS